MMMGVVAARPGIYARPLALVLVQAAVGSACTLCLGFPEQTPADHLVTGHCVVLARPSGDNPFRYAPSEVLKGEFDGQEIELLVDSGTRRRLQNCPQRHVVLVQASPRGGWRSLGVASQAYERVVRRVVLLSPTAQAERDRQTLFLTLFGDADRQTRELAYLEMGRAPYQRIRQLGRSVPRECFAEMLHERRYFEWRSLAILLVAQSDDLEEQRWIRESFDTTQRLGLYRHLSAWAAALIEVDGVAAVDAIESLYWQRTDRRREELAEIARALSLHAEGGSSRSVVAAARRLLRQRPTLIPPESMVVRNHRVSHPSKFVVMHHQRPWARRGSTEAAGLGD